MALDPDDIRNMMTEIWQMTIGQPAEPSARSPIPGVDWLVGCVQITGTWRGTVTMACPPQLMDRVTARIHGVPEEQVTAELRADMVRELVNMLGGNLKALLPPPCYLSLPAVSVGGGFDPPGVTRTRVTSVVFEDDGWPFVATVAETRPLQPGRQRLPERPSGIGPLSDCEASGRFPRC